MTLNFIITFLSHCNDISILYECAYVIVGNLPSRKDYKSE